MNTPRVEKVKISLCQFDLTVFYVVLGGVSVKRLRGDMRLNFP